MFNLENRKMLVTGASGALGRAIALSFYRQGANITITGRNQQNLESLAQELNDLNQNGDNQCQIIPLDLSNDEERKKLIPLAVEAMDGLDTLVNNAGVTKDGLALTMREAAWDDVLTMNLKVAFMLSQASLRPLIKSGMGRIINIASIVGMTGNAGQSNYAAAKAGLIGFSKSLAKEMASRDITVNCIAPGFIESPMTNVLTEDQKSKILPSIPAGVIGKPEDIAAGAVYLASQEASYITGQTLHINGGMYM